MNVTTYENNAKWGAEVILNDLAELMPQQAKGDSSAFLASCDLIAKKAKLLLKKIETYEANLKKTNQYQNKNSVALYIYYSQAKHGQSLKRIMIEAYAFVSYLRKWLTETTIEYLIAVEDKKTVQVLHLTIEDLIRTMSLGVSKDKGFRLSLSKLNMTNKMLNDLEHFDNFEEELKVIEKNLTNILQQVTVRSNKAKNVKRKRLMNALGISGEKLNKGFVTETAVQMYAALGNGAKNITDPALLAAYYRNTVGNLPGFRGGDIDEETSAKFLQQEGEDFQRKVEFQVKRVQGLFGATVIEINTLKYELFNIYIIITKTKKYGAKALGEELHNYFTSTTRAYNVAQQLTQSLSITLEKNLSQILENI